MASKSIQIAAAQRSEMGSRANKRLRDSGQVPGVIYGHKEAVIPLKLNRKELSTHLAKGAHVFDLQVDGKVEKVLVKEVQYDHLGIEVIHVDFSRVSLDEKVEVTVPLELKGTPKGEADGGVLQQIISEFEVECLVTEIPDVLRYNVSEMKLNDVLHVKDIPLPAGVRVLQDGELIVATVREILETAEEAAAAAAESAEPEIIGKKKEEGEEGAEGAAAPAEKK